MSDLIDRQYVIDTLELGLENDYVDATELLAYVKQLPSAEPERKMGRKFLEIVIEYPKVCTYPEYEGKPYYSIKYEENGEMIVGFGTYKPKVLSQYLREYFIPSAELEREKGEWIYDGKRGRFPACKCSICGHYENADWALLQGANFCPHCGADMRGE